MKKSKIVNLVLITAALASCNKTEKKHEKKYFMRGDSTAAYESPVRNHQHNSVGPIIWFYAFRPYGFYDVHNSRYVHSGSYSSSVSESSNIGRSASKSGVIRGGLGGGRFSVSS